MDINAILDNNGYDVTNPNYNSNTKKGRLESPTLKAENIGEAHPFITSAYEKNKTDAFMFNVNDYEKYVNAGINLNKNEDTKQWDKLLSESQSNWSKAVNALGQTLVSELLIGIPKGFSDLVDSIGQAVGLSDHDYSNPVSQFLEEKQEEFKQWAPVYSDPDKNISNGGLTDAGWWFSNLPSIASSLTLFIPSMGITKGVSYLGKLSKLSKYTNRAARAIINPVMKATTGKGLTSYELGRNFEVGLSAALSRTMENYQEARQTYNDNYIDAANTLNAMSPEEYNNFLQSNANYIDANNIDTSDRDAVAKQIARNAADRTFQLDWANIIFDVYQMHGLRNILSHAPKFTKSAATSAAQRNAIRTAGMTEAKAAETLAKDSKLTKAGYWVKDNLFGFGRQIKSELSEGVEEAVNFIAQQEGTHLGKYLLTGEDGTLADLDLFSSIGPMTSRILNDYSKDASLWDSAFFGVLGGVVFQGGASKLNRLTQTIENIKNEKKSANKNDDTTKEAKVTPHWWSLDQSAETERMLTEINGRNFKLNTMRQTMQQINSGKNPYIKNADSTNPDISSPVEERMLREKAYTEYLDELIVSARNNGTLDMLEAYMEDENVRNAVVEAYTSGDESNKISKEEAQEAAAKALDRIKKIDRLYQNEIIHASDIADKVGDKEGTPLPAEYIQMIASANVRHRLNLERYDEVAAMYNEDTERIKSVFGDKFDSSIDYQSLVSLRATIQELSSLVAQRKELEAKQAENPTITRQYDIEELDQQIGLIKRKALQTSTDAQFARALYALTVANSAVREYAPDGKSFKVNADDTELIGKLDEFLMKDLSYVFDDLGQEKRTNISNDAVIGELKKVMNDMKYVLPVNDNGKLENADSYLQNLDPKLPDNYDILARIELEKIKENAKLAETENEIRHYIGAINNMENIARNAAINNAFETIKDIQKNHTDIALVDIINRIYENNSSDWLIDTNTLNTEERNKLDEALKVLNLANVKNRTLFEQLTQSLIFYKATLSQVEANDKQNTEKAQPSTDTTTDNSDDEQKQNFSASQNLNTDDKSDELINQSGEGTEQRTEQGNGQISQDNGANNPTAITLSYNGNTINYSVPQGNNEDIKSVISIKPVGDNTYELDFIGKGTDVKPEDISNLGLFEINYQPMDGGVVKRNPIVRLNNGKVEVAVRGIVDKPDTSSTGEQSGNGQQAANTNQAEATTTPETPITQTGTVHNIKTEPKVVGEDVSEYYIEISTAAREAALKIKNGETVTYEEYIQSLSDIKAKINDDAAFKQAADDNWNNNMQRLAKKYPKLVDSLITILDSSTTEEIADTNFRRVFNNTFTDAVEKLVKAYLKDINQKPINGKYVISLENLLRYCNGEFKNNENAEILYNILADYLLSDEAKTKYTVIESESEITDPQFLNNVKTPLEERIDKAIKEENHRINTKDIKNKEVFDELEEGSELTVERKNNRIVFSFEGKEVGYIGIPRVVNGTYTSPYEFFLFSIRPDGKNTYYSKLADVFKSIVNAESGDLKEIYDAALDRSISLNNNNTWAAIKRDYTVHTTDPETGEEYDQVNDRLLNVIKTMASFAVKYGSAEKAIDGWFNALAQEYIAADTLAKNKDAKVVIDAISNGFIIRATDRLTDDEKNIIQSEVDKLPLVSEAIGRNNKGRVSLAIGSRKQAGTVNCVVKKENDKVIIPATYSFPGVGYPNTFVGIPIAKGQVLFAQAYPITARHLKADSEASKIVGAFANQIVKYLEDIANNPTEYQRFKELQDFLFEALNYKNSTTPLFHMDNCEKVNVGDSRGTHIGTNGRRGPRRDLRIFCNPGKINKIQIQNGNTSELIDITPENINKIKNYVKQFLADTLQFNISENYIASDNNKRNQVEGLATRNKDGKFVVKIGDESWVFDSYNDFILNNDLVRLNTEPNEYGNNVTRTSRNPNVRYKIVTSSPVERNTTNQTTDSVLNRDILKEANIIMSSSRQDKAVGLVSLIFDNNVVDSLVKYDLLPHDLVFDSNFNTGEGREELNASFNKTTKVTTIGPRFMGFLSHHNEAYRKLAVRKLIHERLHDILHSNGNEHYIKDIESIYDEFCKYLDDAEFSKPILDRYLKKIKLNKSLDEYYNDFKKYKYLSKQKNTSDLIKYLETLKKEELYKYVDTFKIIDRNFVDNNTLEELAKYINKLKSIEEFLVDTLTSVELANYLNNVTTLSKANMRERKRDTLLNKIMRLLAKIMGINIKDNSLYAQEFEALRNAMNTEPIDIDKASTLKPDTSYKPSVNADDTNINNDNTDNNDADNNNDVDTNDNKKESANKRVFNIINNEANDEEYSSTTEILEDELPSELQEIKDKAIADGTFMKAPNGKSTNLTERQWLQVRTKAFKDWFGDWENESANASKVVDENGEPLVVYHGTQSLEKFSEFNKDTAIYTTNELLTAISYVPDKLYEYTEKLTEGSSTKEVLDVLQYYTSQLKKGEPFDYFDYNYTVLKRTLEPLGITVEEKNTYTIEDLEKYKNLVKATNIPIKLAKGVDAFVKPLFGKIKNPIIIDAKGNMWNNISFNGKIYSTRELEQLYKNTEYDGIIIKNILDYAGAGSLPSIIYIQYNPNQIKSATDNIGTFDTNNDDIRYSDTIEEYETVASIGDYIQSYSPEDRAEIAREINNGNISIKCK